VVNTNVEFGQYMKRRGKDGASRQVLVYPVGVCVSIGSVLPGSVRVTSAAEEMVDGMAAVVVRSGTRKRWPFHQRDEVFPVLGGAGFHTETFSRSAELSIGPSRVPKRVAWRDHLIIPDYPEQGWRSIVMRKQ
jgi:hypothetical protein